jgi:hypothetical protein
MQIKKLHDTTSNRQVLKKAYKLLLTKVERICNFCPYHGGENAFRKRKDKRNWKRLRTTQWRPKG